MIFEPGLCRHVVGARLFDVVIGGLRVGILAGEFEFGHCCREDRCAHIRGHAFQGMCGACGQRQIAAADLRRQEVEQFLAGSPERFENLTDAVRAGRGNQPVELFDLDMSVLCVHRVIHVLAPPRRRPEIRRMPGLGRL